MQIEKFIENEIVILLPKELEKERLDEQGKQIPVGMSLADLVITEDDYTYIIEIKDFSCTTASETRKKTDIKSLKSHDLISNKLTPKARDSYTFLHLMERIKRKIIYIVLLGLDDIEQLNNEVFLGTYKEKLLENIRKEADEPWKNKHITDCIVCSLDTWNEHFQEWPAYREPQKEAQ